MAHTRRNVVARTSSAGNPITQSVTVNVGDTVLVLLLNVIGAVVRAGGAPSFPGKSWTQAGSAQIAAASPEASAEIWYLLNPLPGTYTLTIPNTGALTTKYTVEAGQALAGGTSEFDAANGANNTATNPSPGAITISKAGAAAWAVTAGGWTTWNPSAQAGTIIANTDDGATGGGEQYTLDPAVGSLTLGWTFGTSDDWGAVVAAFRELAPPVFNNQLNLAQCRSN